jgi:amicyanin
VNPSQLHSGRRFRTSRLLGALLLGGLALGAVVAAPAQAEALLAADHAQHGAAALAEAPAVAPSQQAAPDGAVAAEIRGFIFQPSPLVVPVGSTVTWTNQDAIQHSVSADSAPSPASSFDSGFFTQGQTFSFTFAEAGTYTYHCNRHPSMQGQIQVQ